VSALDNLLTEQQAADLLLLRPSTLRDYARRGKVPSVKIGKHRRYVRPDLEAWLDDLRRAG
jgi:excisionase family DNA binding protein